MRWSGAHWSRRTTGPFWLLFYHLNVLFCVVRNNPPNQKFSYCGFHILTYVTVTFNPLRSPESDSELYLRKKTRRKQGPFAFLSSSSVCFFTPCAFGRDFHLGLSSPKHKYFQTQHAPQFEGDIHRNRNAPSRSSRYSRTRRISCLLRAWSPRFPLVT